MTHVANVLGIGSEEAVRRLRETGFADVQVLVSGRRREGVPRVIRQKCIDGKIELVVSYFKQLDLVKEQ